jgi:hypothetical protein
MVSSDVVVYTKEVALRDDSSQVLRLLCGRAEAEIASAKRKDLREEGYILMDVFKIRVF